MQKLSEKKIKIINKNGQTVPAPSSASKSLVFFGFFTSTRTKSREKSTVSILKEPIFKGVKTHVPRADLDAVKSWVGLEEKIVHDYKEQKTDFFKRRSLFKRDKTHVSRENLDAGKSWVGLEEKIVQDYKCQKIGFFKRLPLFRKAPEIRAIVPTDPEAKAFVTQAAETKASVAQAPEINVPEVKISVPKAPAKPSLPAFETFSTQTTVTLPSDVLKAKDAIRVSQEKSRGIGRSFSVLVGLAVCALAVVFIQGILSNQGTSQQLAKLQSEKQQLEQSYAELKSASADQTAEMQWMSSQLRDMNAKLKIAQDQKNAFGQSLEKKYREELMRLNVEYEAQLDALRGDVQTRDAIINALRAQAQAFEAILDPASLAAVSGVAAGFSGQPFSRAGTSVSQGKILSINGRRGFAVIDLGGEQGALSGREVVISRNGTELTTGRIDRIYPSMSSILVRNAGILSILKEGDTVSFS